MKRLLLATLVAAVGCSKAEDTTAITITSDCLPRDVKVSPDTAVSIGGDTLDFKGTVRAACLEFPTTVFWRSMDTSVVRVVGDSGRARTVGPGTTRFLAISTADTTIRGAAIVNVVPPLGIAPASAALNIGDRIQFAASSDARTGPILWSSSDTTVVTVDATGLALLKKSGSAYVIATASANPHLRGKAFLTAAFGCNCFGPTISTVNYGPSGKPANLDSLAGPIDVTVTSSGPGTMDLIVNDGNRDTVVVTEPVSNNSMSWYSVLRWNTDARLPGGASAFPNGAYTLRIRSHPSGTTQTDESTRLSARLRNP